MGETMVIRLDDDTDKSLSKYTEEPLNILYLGIEKKEGFANAIHMQWNKFSNFGNSCSGFFRSEAEDPYTDLWFMDRVVLLGSQQHVFNDSLRDYWKFIRGIHDLDLNVAAVLTPGYDLPENNKNIDLVVRTADRTGSRVCVSDIARQLDKFFCTEDD